MSDVIYELQKIRTAIESTLKQVKKLSDDSKRIFELEREISVLKSVLKLNSETTALSETEYKTKIRKALLDETE